MTHQDQVIELLKKQIGNPNEVQEIRETAEAVVKKWVNPMSTGKETTNGLIYGLVQSGKTGVLATTGAMGADAGYKTIIILTSDIDPLYSQTLGRVQEAFPGIDIIGKQDFKDAEAFVKRVKGGRCAIVTSKNANILGTLIENFRMGRVRTLSCLIIDDEADQASLNTRAKKDDGTRSTINDRINELRSFFERNTYLQVTATPQALFLQIPGHDFRPKFTVLSHPGSDYVGGDDFFADNTRLAREFALADILTLSPGPQPAPTLDIPRSLLQALDTFMIGATYKRLRDADQNCAFLCHVSTRKDDHRHIVDLLRKYKAELTEGVADRNPTTLSRLRQAFDELSSTHPGLRDSDFDKLVEAIEFFSPGISVKLVNGDTDEDVAVRSPYNLFVGGNKLGRGVTIKNLLVSYYGRHPKNPQADTVLQHARMYGYRRKDVGLLRLFLPRELLIVFRAIHQMEKSLRDLIARNPIEQFRGVYLENGLNPTRKNVLAPGSVGVYSAGSNYNPAQVVRNGAVHSSTLKIDSMLSHVENKATVEMSINDIRNLLLLIMPDESFSEEIWNSSALSESLLAYADLKKQSTGFVFVDRDRDLGKERRESAGIISGGEVLRVPADRIALFILRTKAEGNNHAAWWPQIRFPDGPYAFAFAI